MIYLPRYGGFVIRKVSNVKLTFKITQSHWFGAIRYDFLLVFVVIVSLSCTVSEILLESIHALVAKI